ncbi:right-handed parallel beta-helix repeat-containing protein [Streptomyces sp. NPDC004610]|uniref:right-handed parallel beta-helix repeat-containing protein n=1 Tax=unclassified Streptomyces TaxID=2593676 RepID=UPI0033A7F5A0
MMRLSRTLSAGWFAAAGVTATTGLLGVLTAAPTATATALTAQQVSCGQTVTTNVVLGADLLDCPGDGLIVGAHDLTIDLNGHTVDGVGLGTGIRTNGFDRTTVTNSAATPAEVQEFDHGVQLTPGTSGTIVEKLTLRLNEWAGVELDNADTGNRVRNNTVTQQSQRGIVLSGADGNTIADNTVAANQGEGVYIENSASNRIERNSITDSGDAALVLEGSSTNTLLSNTVEGSSDGAIVLRLASDDNLVQSNSATQNSDAGLSLSDSTGNRVLSNTFHGSGDSGIALQYAHHTTITGNDVSGNPGGIELSQSDHNAIRSNIANDTTGDGISVESSLGNTLELNQVNRNDSRGIYVVGEAATGTGNRILRNTANGNSADGIHVSKFIHTLQGNTTRDNLGWGIYAEQGNADGGANRASGNAEPAQCSGVICTP